MKRRLETAPLTDEDGEIWDAVSMTMFLRHGAACLWDWAEESDQQDADLMLYAQVWRRSAWRTLEWGDYNAMWHGPMFHGELLLGGRWPTGLPLYGRP